MKYNFGEIANLAQQHQTLVSALEDVFNDMITKVSNTQAEGFNAASAVVFMEKLRDRWNQRAGEWAATQGNLANAVNNHGSDVQQTDAGPMSNIFNNIAI